MFDKKVKFYIIKAYIIFLAESVNDYSKIMILKYIQTMTSTSLKNTPFYHIYEPQRLSEASWLPKICIIHYKI